MAVQFQPQVWGDKVFSPVTKAIQAERDRQHQKGIADAQNALAQNRINEQARHNKAQEGYQNNLLNLIQLPGVKQQTARHEQKLVDDAAIDMHTQRTQVQSADQANYEAEILDIERGAKSWFTPDKMNQVYNPMTYTFGTGESLASHLGLYKTEEELKNQITAPNYQYKVDPNVSSNINTMLSNSISVHKGTSSQDLMNVGKVD